MPLDVVLCHPPVNSWRGKALPGRPNGLADGPNFMQFSSRYDGRRLPARPPFTLARCFKSLVDWFDYAYAAVPAAAAWVRNPSFHLRPRRSPAVIHLRGTFGREVRLVPNHTEKSPRLGVRRPLAKVGVFSSVLAIAYLAFAIATGGPSVATAPAFQASSNVAFDSASSPRVTTQRVFEVSQAQIEETVTVATPVKTLQSAIEAQATLAPVTAAETSAEAVQPIATLAVAPAPVATAVPEVHTAAVPLATPVPQAAVAPALAPRTSTVYTAAEIRAFAVAAGWSGAHLDDVVQIAWCESSNNAAAIGATGARGLMQIMPLWFTEAGVDLATWSDPVTNLKVALVAFQTRIAESRDPWSAWDCQPSH